MKTAICGSGPLALEAAIHFHNMDADVVLLGKEPLGGMAGRIHDFFPDLSMEMPFCDITTSLGRKITGTQARFGIPTVKEYWEDYLFPLTQKIPSGIVWKKTRALRVQKRFLKPNENPIGRSRLMDLFRVFYTIKPREAMDNVSQAHLLKTDPSLLQPFENMMDVDIVIDARGTFHNPCPTGGKGGFALNEINFLKDSDVIHGFHEQKKVPQSLPQNIVLAGSEAMAALWILFLFPRIKDSHLLIISNETQPFSSIKQKKLSSLLDAILEKNEKDRLEQESLHEKKLDFFKKSDDPVLKKKGPPVKPIPYIDIVKDARITSMDRLSDRKGIFVTVESGFRSRKEKIQTFNADLLIVEEGYERDSSFAKGLNGTQDSPEPGFYTLGATGHLSDGIREIRSMEDDLLRYFSKR